MSAGALALSAVVAEAAPVLAPAAAEAEAPAGQVYANSLNFRTRKNIVPLQKFSAQKVAEGVPDSKLTRETTGLLREYSTPLLIAHSHRAFFWADEFSRQTGKPYDKELLFICAAFHDLGLLKPFRTEDDRFEVDSAEEKQRLFENTARALAPASKEVRDRHVSNCSKADQAYGEGVAKALEVVLAAQ